VLTHPEFDYYKESWEDKKEFASRPRALPISFWATPWQASRQDPG
jgi:hypothetical protein